MKKTITLLTCIGICVVAVRLNAQDNSTSGDKTNTVSAHHDHEHHSHKGEHHKRGIHIFHRHHGKHEAHGNRGDHQRGRSKGQTDQRKK